MLRPLKKNFTPAEYLAMEQVADYKSEYYAGQIYALAGGTADHSLIAGNCIHVLNEQLETEPCRVFASDMRLLVQPSGLYTYPDAMVICGDIKFVERRNDTVTNPIVIVEVLSESTREYDRGTKFDFYKQLPGLSEIVLVESEYARVECYRRGQEDQWLLETHDALDATARLESLACDLPLHRIYHKVSWLD